MKKLILLISLMFLIGRAAEIIDPSALRSPAEVLRFGEKFTYQASVIGLNQTANIYLWTDSLSYCNDPILKDTCYRFVFFTKIDPPNRYISMIESKLESYARQTDLVSKRFEKHLIEKSKEQHMIVNFNLEKNRAYYEKDSTVYSKDQTTVDSSGLAVSCYFERHDFINIFYYLRLLKKFEINDTFRIRSFAENKRRVYPLTVVIVREETITVPAGKFDCWVVKCCVRETGLFSTGDVYLWIAKNDQRTIVQITQGYKVFMKWISLVLKLTSIS